MTTHVGSIARPPDLLDLMRARGNGGSGDQEQQYDRSVREAVKACVARQAAAGLDSVSDGEQGKIGHATYISERLAGFEPGDEMSAAVHALFAAEIEEFPQYYERYFSEAMHGGSVATTTWLRCTGPVSYCGEDALTRDLENLRAAVDALGPDWAGEVFMPAIAPSGAGSNAYYPSEHDYLLAVGEALRTEYEAIAAAGFILQIDDPFMSEIYSDPASSLSECRERAEAYVDAINHAVRNLSPDQIRFHTCYGINEGPRVHDVSLEDIIDVVLSVNAGAYSFEAANPRHEHEYHIWERVTLPEGKILMPGMLSHSSNIVEHPELIAERITRFAERVGRENVIASADCGFASQPSYRPEVDPDVVWAKFGALSAGARLATARLW